MDITILEREGVQYMTIYDYSDLLKMIANINTDKIIAKNNGFDWDGYNNIRQRISIQIKLSQKMKEQ